MGRCNLINRCLRRLICGFLCDIVGGLTGKDGIPGDKIGKINVNSNWSYVAINSELVKTALKKIQNDKLKGKTFRVRILS
jgi:ATP-independent RNA helicase DbpA